MIRLWIDTSATYTGNDYIREMQKYGFVKKDLGPNELFDYYQAEREYFDSFYYDPTLRDVRSAGIQ